jgi:hypothetical protein
MLKKPCLCILGLLLMGMLCVPVAAETGDQGYWSFYIINDINAISDLKLNGHEDNWSHGDLYNKVYVSDTLDQIDVEFDVTAGADTNLTITKDSITRLRKERPGLWEPALYAWGGFLTYDVDAGWLDPAVARGDDTYAHSFTVAEHIRERGAVHHQTGDTKYMEWYAPLKKGNLHVCYVRS